jgi:hypothetical protein
MTQNDCELDGQAVGRIIQARDVRANTGGTLYNPTLKCKEKKNLAADLKPYKRYRNSGHHQQQITRDIPAETSHPSGISCVITEIACGFSESIDRIRSIILEYSLLLRFQFCLVSDTDWSPAPQTRVARQRSSRWPILQLRPR